MAFSNLQGLIYYKTQPTNKPSLSVHKKVLQFFFHSSYMNILKSV